ncbi:MAG: type II toxin-antitoxin system RelE/ParE family toxin [Saprospiraceae bacterium]
MIRSFGDKETERIWLGTFSKKLPADIQHTARRKLRMLNNAQSLDDLRIPPANRLEKLSGSLSDFYSIRINAQWRVVFKWVNPEATEVRIMDDH